jgi:hypothetical protein
MLSLSEIKRLSILISGRHPKCAFEFDSKTISTFFEKSGVTIDEISKYRNDDEPTFLWVMDLLRYLSKKKKFQEILKKYFKEAEFYNKEARELFKDEIEELSVKNTVGIFMDFDNGREFLFENVFRPAIELLELKAVKVDNITKSGQDLHRVIQEMINSYSVFVVDISGNGKNKFVELGELLALNKNIILLKEEGEKRPFNINHLKMIDYPKANRDPDQAKQDHDELKVKIKEAIKDFFN